MSAHSRDKGRAFEQLIVRAFKKRWPDRVIRRGKQSHHADEPDVVIEGSSLWIETFHSSVTSPLKKLAQAERDIARGGVHWWPVVVWRKTGGRTIQATMRVIALVATTGGEFWGGGNDLVVTLDFEDWLGQAVPP